MQPTAPVSVDAPLTERVDSQVTPAERVDVPSTVRASDRVAVPVTARVDPQVAADWRLVVPATLRLLLAVTAPVKVDEAVTHFLVCPLSLERRCRTRGGLVHAHGRYLVPGAYCDAFWVPEIIVE